MLPTTNASPNVRRGRKAPRSVSEVLNVGYISCELVRRSVVIGLFSNSFEPFEHTEHDSHREEAESGENRPGHPL